MVDRIKNGEIDLVINTPLGAASKFDETAIRRAALESSLPYVTTISAAEVTVQALKHLGTEEMKKVKSIQDWHCERHLINQQVIHRLGVASEVTVNLADGCCFLYECSNILRFLLWKSKRRA